MQINFDVKNVSGIFGRLNMQIIPSSLENNPTCQESIVVDETAFSLIEKFFLDEGEAYAHWGNTYINSNKVKLIISELRLFYNFIEKSNKISSEDVKLIFEEDTEIFISNFLDLKNDALEMIFKVINFLEKIIDKKIDGITVIGV